MQNEHRRFLQPPKIRVNYKDHVLSDDSQVANKRVQFEENISKDLNFHKSSSLNKKLPQVLSLQQTFTFPRNFAQENANKRKEICTQTSKTLIQLVKGQGTSTDDFGDAEESVDSGKYSDSRRTLKCRYKPSSHSLIITPRKPIPKTLSRRSERERERQKEQLSDKKPEKHRERVREAHATETFLMETPAEKEVLKQFGYNEFLHEQQQRVGDAEQQPQVNVQSTSDEYLPPPPPPLTAISSEAFLFKNSINLSTVIDQLQNPRWDIVLQGLNDLIYLVQHVTWNSHHEREVAVINRRLIDMLKSPRSNVCRVACQASGDMFRFAQCTRRPEFDELVEGLLMKTADTNRFIQKDANVALDKMTTYIAPNHAIRALTSKGPFHKNGLVRVAAARLVVCACAVAGVDQILGPLSHMQTRKRVIDNLARFLVDKNQDVRKYGEHLYKLLKRHKFFEEYFYKDLTVAQKNSLRKIIYTFQE